jgi:alkylation response protein AidB-like acyl-CoA dehydrogenase
MMPFQSSTHDSASLSLSDPLDMAAISSTNTVTAELHNWFLPDDRVLFLKPPNWMQANSQTNVLHHSFFALGCARAGLDILATAAEKKSFPFLHRSFEQLDDELNRCREAIFAADGEVVKAYEDRLSLRAWAIDLAGRCTFAAVSACSGASNSSQHPAQRVYREALVYAVSGQTQDVMQATLQRLAR